MMGTRIGQKLWNLGRMDDRREMVVGALGVRFGSDVALSFTEAINALDDLERLNELHDLAIRCASLDEFRLGLAIAPARRSRQR